MKIIHLNPAPDIGASDRFVEIDGHRLLMDAGVHPNIEGREALPLYKSRDASEKLFCSDKSFLGNRTARAMSDDVLEGKSFVEFVALIIRSRIYTL